MYTPDLIQRIYFQKEKGNDTNYQRVFRDLRSHDPEAMFQFEWESRQICWTCFESRKYLDIINEDDGCIYFYLRDAGLEFEIVIPGHSLKEELNKAIHERIGVFHAIWVVGEYFPGLEINRDRPIKINLQKIRRYNHEKKGKLNFWFGKMLTQYSTLKAPIFECIDYPKVDKGEKSWKKIADKKK